MINSSYCGEVEQNGPLVGSIPVEATASMVFEDIELTAVALTTVHSQTVAFLGTSQGHLKKVSKLVARTKTRLMQSFAYRMWKLVM